jgi:hypothetical protein
MEFSILDRDTYLQQLQTIHGLRGALDLDDESYRQLLDRLTGSRSAKFMTAEQRQRVITFMEVHRALDDALERLEEARDTLNTSFASAPHGFMAKTVYLDGERLTTMASSVEEVIATVRSQHGSEIRLVGAEERRFGGQTVLELKFERPAVQLLAS